MVKKNELAVTMPRNRSGPLSPEQREVAKRMFLEAMGRVNIFAAAAAQAGVSRQTILAWIHEDFITQDELSDALKQYKDYVRSELAKRMFVGEERPLVSNGRIVYNRRGEEVLIHEKDNKLLLEYAKKLLEEWQVPDKKDITIHTDAIPEKFVIQLDSRLLEPEEWEQITQIAEAVEARTLAREGRLIEGSVEH